MKMVRYSLLWSYIFSSFLFAQWIQNSGPEGGAVYAIYADAPYLYIGLAGAGVFRSSDGGETWSQKITGMGYQYTTVINKSGAYLLATGTVGLFRSTDNGDTWTAVTGLPAANGVSSITVDGANVIAGTLGKGIYLSTDNGGTWAAASSGLPGNGDNTFVGSVVANGSIILASATDNNTTTTMYRSTNLGASWLPANNGLPLDYSLYYTLCLDGSTIYAGGPFLYKTTNNGDNWIQAENGIPNYSGISNIAANSSLVFSAAFNHLYRSTNSGSSWVPAGGGLPLMNFNSVNISGATVYSGTIANGVYKSTDEGINWAQVVSGLKARDMSGFFVDGTALYGNGNSIFKTTDDGGIWTNIRGNMKDSSSQPTLVYVNESVLFARDSPSQGLERSTDGGATWHQVGSGLPSLGSVQSIVSSGASLLTTSNGRVYKSNDNGNTWFQSDNSIVQFVYFNFVTRIGSTVYAHGMNVFRSTDDGITWLDSDNGMEAFYQVDAIASNGSYLFAGGQFSSNTYRSSNDGDSWELGAPLPSNGMINQYLGYGNNIFACSPNNGIFISTNNGSSWTKISTGLPSSNYRYTLAIHNGWMFAGTSGNSVWKRPVTDVTEIDEEISQSPTNFLLMQNYPNPFNPSTTIKYTIPSVSLSAIEGIRVQLKVYDILGNEVATLLDEYREAGKYEVEFKAAKLSSGIYFYKLSAGSFTETKKMILLR